MKKSNLSIEVLVKGRPVREFYHHDGNTYIEGRKNSSFELRIRNDNSNRVLVVPSVDGLSVMDGKKADSKSNGYVINGFSSLTIPGWRLDNEEVAQFFFQGKKGKGYAAQMEEGGNEGVIGFMFFEEKALTSWTTIIVKEIEKQPYYPPYPWAEPYRWPYDPFKPYWYTTYSNSIESGRGMSSGGTSAGTPDITFSSTNAAFKNPGDSSYTFTANAAAPGEENCSVNVCQSIAPVVEEEDHVSVGFGEAMDHAVSTTSFDRGDHLETFAIYYDTRKGLEQRGIEVVNPSPRSAPNPFPGDKGCIPPPDWAKS